MWMVSGPKGHTPSPINTTGNNRISLGHTRAAAPITSQIFSRHGPVSRTAKRPAKPAAVLDSGACREGPPVKGRRPTPASAKHSGREISKSSTTTAASGQLPSNPMKPLGEVPWPPEPIQTERTMLRETRHEDRPALAELLSSETVQAYLGGPRHTREELEQLMPADPNTRPGIFAVEHAGALIGRITVQRRDRSWAHHVRPEGDEVEIGYEFLPTSWGRGLATEATRAALGWISATLPGEPVVLTTQVANERSLRLARRLGFVEVERFTAYGTEQWFGHLGAPR